jgi:putative transcriptional regulator
MLDMHAISWYILDVKQALLLSETIMKNRITELRKAKHLTQQELANCLGVTRQTIISLEGGRYNPSITLAFKLARTFDLRIEDIFIYEEGDEA